MRNSRDIVAIAILLLVFVVGGVLLGGRGAAPPNTVADENSPNPSVTNDRATGSKGVYEWVSHLGYQAAPWRQKWSHLDPGSRDLLVVIDPRTQNSLANLSGGLGDAKEAELDAQDAETLRHWLNSGSGHTALLFSSRLASGQSGPNASPDDEQTFGDALDLVVQATGIAANAQNHQEFAPVQPVMDTQGILSIHSESAARISRARSDALALFADRAGPLALVVPVGKGRLIAVADGEMLSNSNLPKSENALFLANLLTHYSRPGGRVLFDEYHHGDIAGDQLGTLWEALGRPFQLVLIQLLLAGAFLAILLSGRLGPPVPLRRGAARTSADYVASVASLYRRAEASGTALETLYRQFLREICGRLGLPPDINLERLAEVAARRGQVDKERMRRLLATCELRLDAGSVTETELLDLTREMDQIRKDIGIA